VSESSVSAPSRYKAAFDIQLSTNNTAQFVWLQAGTLKGRFSDNGFMIHTPVKTLQFFALEDTTVTELQSNLNVTFLNEIWAELD